MPVERTSMLIEPGEWPGVGRRTMDPVAADVVARAGVTREAQLGQSLELLVTTPILGTLLNDLPSAAGR